MPTTLEIKMSNTISCPGCESTIEHTYNEELEEGCPAYGVYQCRDCHELFTGPYIFTQEVDYFEEIKPLLTFDSADDFYFLQILRRKKDNPDNTSNSTIIKSYYIKNIEYYEKKIPEIKKICRTFNARAGLRLNKRSFKKTALLTMKLILEQGMSDNWEYARRVYDSAAGKSHNAKTKTWIIDIDDTDDEGTAKEVEKFILTLRPEGDKVIKTLKTRSGFHLVTRPFDVQAFSKEYSLDIHKDNPINVFIPEVQGGER